MNCIDVTLYFNELQLRAIENVLADDGITLEDKFKECFDSLYQQLVPAEQRHSIEEVIKKVEDAENKEREKRLRFGVFHIRENERDRYFTSIAFQSLLSSAYRYRLYDRGELCANPNSFADAFGDVKYISAAEYEELCNRMSNDIRITAMVDYDLDAGTVRACLSRNNLWLTYRLKDLSVASFKAQRGAYRVSDDREKIFKNALAGKEISASEA